MESLLPIILALVLNIIPAEATDFTIQIAEGDDSIELQFKKQEDGGWESQLGQAGKEPSTYYISGTKLTVKNSGKTSENDLAKHLTIGATLFKVRHRADGLEFLVKEEEKDSRVVRARWKLEKE
jgi:hypothetical protein